MCGLVLFLQDLTFLQGGRRETSLLTYANLSHEAGISRNYVMAVVSTATLCVCCGNEISNAADRRNIFIKLSRYKLMVRDREQKERPT